MHGPINIVLQSIYNLSTQNSEEERKNQLFGGTVWLNPGNIKITQDENERQQTSILRLTRNKENKPQCFWTETEYPVAELFQYMWPNCHFLLTTSNIPTF